MSPEQLAACLPDDAPPELAAAVAIGAGQIDPTMLLRLMQDAERARDLLAAGDLDGARALVEPYRLMAESAGLGELYEQFVGSLFEAGC